MVAFVQKAMHFGWGKYRNYRKINMDVRVLLFSLIMSMMGTDLHQAKPKIRGPFGRQRQKHSGTL